jgi:hemolysin activation/secretion protein
MMSFLLPAGAALRRRVVTLAACAVLPLLMAVDALAIEADAQGEGPTDAAAADAAGADVRFDILEFRVSGNTVLPQVRIEQLLYPFLGPGGDFARIQAAQAALAAEYRAAGYAAAAVDVPEQALDGGVVQLLVVEGVVERLRISGARYVSGRRLGERLPSLRSGRVFHLPSAQQELSALGSDSRRITPALQAGSQPGTVDVELMVEDRLPLRAGLTVSNAASSNTSQTRLNGEIGYGNLFQRDHSISLSYQLTPEKPDEVRALVGTYVARFRDSRDVLALYAVNTDSDVSAVGDITVLGSGSVFGARYVHPFAGPEGSTRSLTVGIDYKDFDDTTTLGTAELESGIRYWKAMLSFTGGSRTERAATQFGVGVDLAMRHAGNRQQEFEDKRFKGETDFFYLSANLRHERMLPWGDARALVELSARLTEDPLISNEQWGLGGRSSVRGYLESEGLMDYGVGARLTLVEPLLLPGDPATAAESGDGMGWRGLVRSLDARLYLDWQGGWIHEPLPDQKDHLYLMSMGLGLTVAGVHGWFGNLDLALPMRDGPFTDAYEPRFLFEVGHDL